MTYLVIGTVALITAFLTLFSGFGLGTLLMPAFALFFPLPVAVASTAVVHGANNLLKVSMLYSDIHMGIVVRFGIPALFSAMLGAFSLNYLSQASDIISYQLFSYQLETSQLKIVLGGLILLFALFDLSPLKKKYQFAEKWLPLGGILSGFFGGLSGHQGAFRSMFLLNCGLSPKEFVATQSVIASIVDLTRLCIYLIGFLGVYTQGQLTESIDIKLVLFATLSAFIGTFIGKQLLEKSNISVVRWVTASLLLLIGTSLVLGLI